MVVTILASVISGLFLCFFFVRLFGGLNSEGRSMTTLAFLLSAVAGTVRLLIDPVGAVYIPVGLAAIAGCALVTTRGKPEMLANPELRRREPDVPDAHLGRRRWTFVAAASAILLTIGLLVTR
jgi:drug/metabolite transporter (DMT)-like permease